MIPRQLGKVAALEATRNPVVTLIGPRQSGKTTLVKATFPDHSYISLERPDRLAAAREDPLGFLAELGPRAIIDEVQRAPDLLSYIQVAVDAHDHPGRFILTGSQNLLLMERVSQSLAGRTAFLTLLPLSLAELQGRSPLDLGTITEAAPGQPPTTSLWETLWRGFYPRLHDRPLDPGRWLADYHRTYVERDLRDVLRVMNLDAFERFVRLVAARTGTVLNLSSLADDAGITQPTARQWLTALRTGFLVELLQPHHVSFSRRLRKQPKLHWLDSGLCCYLLGIDSPGVLAQHPLRGAIFESFVISELMKGAHGAGHEPRLFHWRDTAGHEVDAIVERSGSLLPVEIKSGATVTGDTCRGLRRWLGLEGNPSQTGLLIHGGAERQRRGEVVALPWFAL